MKILEFNRPMDHTYMIEWLGILCSRYKNINIMSIGTSILGKDIPMICLGHGTPQIIYVGAIHGTDSLCTTLLLRFINEYFELTQKGRTIFNINAKYMEDSRTICIVPMLNPDGVDYVINSVEPSNPFYSRLIKLNNESSDFSLWKFNSRGIDIDKNFTFGYQQENGIMPESEPESAALRGIIKFNKNYIKLIIQLEQDNEKLICAPQEPLSYRRIARSIGRIYGHPICSQSSNICPGSLINFAGIEQGIPAYKILYKDQNDIFKTYSDLRETLFVAPTLI